MTVDQDIEGTIELTGQMNAGYAVHEMNLKVRTGLGCSNMVVFQNNDVPF